MKSILLCTIMFISTLGNSQSFFEQLDSGEETNYMYFGFGFQGNSLKNGYTIGSTQFDDRASGINYSFAWEQYGENGWMKLDGSLLLTAVVSAISKYDGLSVSGYNGDKGENEYRYYMLNDKFLHATGGGTFKNSKIGPLFSFGWEGVGLVRILGTKGGELNNAIGEGNIGLVSMGSGINILNPFDFFHSHSRLTFSYDWFLNRKSPEKFWFGTFGRSRFTVEYSAVIARRLTFNASYSFFNFKNAYNVEDPLTFSDNFINARISTFELGAAFNVMAK